MENYQAALFAIVTITTLGTLVAVALVRGGKYPEEMKQERLKLSNPIPKQYLFTVKLLVWGLALGAGLQLGISLMSHVSPRIEVIEIRTEAKAASTSIAQRFEF